MSSVRQQIIDAVETRLKTITTANGYATQIGSKVYVWRKSPLANTELPAVLVQDMAAQVDEEIIGQFTHRLAVRCAVFTSSATSPAQARAALNDLVTALFTDPFWSGLAEGGTTVASHDIMVEHDNNLVCAASVDIDIVYRTARGRV